MLTSFVRWISPFSVECPPFVRFCPVLSMDAGGVDMEAMKENLFLPHFAAFCRIPRDSRASAQRLDEHFSRTWCKEEPELGRGDCH